MRNTPCWFVVGTFGCFQEAFDEYQECIFRGLNLSMFSSYSVSHGCYLIVLSTLIDLSNDGLVQR